VYREHGGTSVALRLVGAWLLLVSGGPPVAGKPAMTSAQPADPGRVSHAMMPRVADCGAACRELAARGAAFMARRLTGAVRSAASCATRTAIWSRSAKPCPPSHSA
jgi:hypothetical protein